MQLSIFDLPVNEPTTESTLQPHNIAPKTGYKPHKDVSIQPDGTILYRGNIGWFTRKEIAVKYGYSDEWQENK